MAGQTHQTALGVFLGFLEEGGFFEHVMEVQVEQSDAWQEGPQHKTGKTPLNNELLRLFGLAVQKRGQKRYELQDAHVIVHIPCLSC